MMNKSTDLVSIGIPFYNSDKYLDFAIRSVLNQSYPNWELILVDDGSKDESLLVAKKYAYDSRITILSDGQNKGLPARLNELSKLAKGKYYARMDADDIMFPNRIEIQLTFMQENPEIDVLGACAVSIDNQNRIVGKRNCRSTVKNSKKDIIQNGCFIHPSVMGKRSWFVNHSYDVGFKRSQDLELWVRTVDSSHFYILEEPMIFYREIGIPTFKKYYESVLAIYTIYNKYVKSKHIRFYLKLLVKLAVYFVFYIFKRTDYLVSRRSEELTDTTYYSELLQKSIS